METLGDPDTGSTSLRISKVFTPTPFLFTVVSVTNPPRFIKTKHSILFRTPEPFNSYTGFSESFGAKSLGSCQQSLYRRVSPHRLRLRSGEVRVRNPSTVSETPKRRRKNFTPVIQDGTSYQFPLLGSLLDSHLGSFSVENTRRKMSNIWGGKYQDLIPQFRGRLYVRPFSSSVPPAA